MVRRNQPVFSMSLGTFWLSRLSANNAKYSRLAKTGLNSIDTSYICTASIISFFADNMLRLINKSPIVTFSYCFSLYEIFLTLFCLNCSFLISSTHNNENKITQRKNSGYHYVWHSELRHHQKSKKMARSWRYWVRISRLHRKQVCWRVSNKLLFQSLVWGLVLNKRGTTYRQLTRNKKTR